MKSEIMDNNVIMDNYKLWYINQEYYNSSVRVYTFKY